MISERLRIGEAAARAGVNIQTLRYYERRGLLEKPTRSVSGYRQYDAEAPRLVRFIKRAQDLGFTLDDVEELLRFRKQGRSPRRVRPLAAAKIHDIDEKIRRLTAMRGALTQLIDSCSCDGSESPCPILEALEIEVEGPAKIESPRIGRR